MKAIVSCAVCLVCLAFGDALGAGLVSDGSAGSAGANERLIVATGVVCRVDRDGGYYFIRSDDGKNYDPGDSLPPPFRKASLRVRIEAGSSGTQPETHKARGETVNIRKIERVDAPPPAPARGGGVRVETTGTIVHVPVEGGFYGIKADNGQRYDPGRSLPADFRKADLRVKFTGTIRTDVMTFRMWGKVLEISMIEVDATGGPVTNTIAPANK